MQFTLVAVLSLVAFAFAAPVDIVARAPQVTAETAAMTNAAGEVVTFSTAGVNQAATAAGQ